MPKKKKCCPGVSSVPKLLIKGGIEVMNLVTGDDSITQIELYLNPRMGVNATGLGAYSDWYTYSNELNPKTESTVLDPEDLPTYRCARVCLPVLNEDLTCDTLQMWEAVSVKTELVGVHSLINVLASFLKTVESGEGRSIQGVNYHMFAIGGEPLDLQGMVMSYKTKYPTGDDKPVNLSNVLGKAPTAVNQGLDPKARTKLLRDGYYPVEIWGPDPGRNENSRYFGSFQSGNNTPTVLQFTNTLTTVLLDENGVGPLCKGDGLYVSCADICGFVNTSANNAVRYHGLPRYFNITLRKRWVKNPYPVSSLLTSFFSNLMPNVTGQPMKGDASQVEEVRVYQGTEPLPGDPDVSRFVDCFGQPRTIMPKLGGNTCNPNSPAPCPCPPPSPATG